jgi:hypothetical protein
MLVTIQFRIFNLPVYCPKRLHVKIQKELILPVALYKCEIWSFTLRKEHRMRALENEVLFNRYYWDDQIRKDEMGVACNMHREMKSTYTILVG